LRFEGQRVRAEGLADTHENVFPELVKTLGGKPVARDYKVLDLLGQVPGVHRTYCGVTDSDPFFLPVECELYSDSGEVWTRMTMTRDARLTKTLKAVRARQAFKWTLTNERSDAQRWVEERGGFVR
jgi:hypothetical protein